VNISQHAMITTRLRFDQPEEWKW